MAAIANVLYGAQSLIKIDDSATQSKGSQGIACFLLAVIDAGDVAI